MRTNSTIYNSIIKQVNNYFKEKLLLSSSNKRISCNHWNHGIFHEYNYRTNLLKEDTPMLLFDLMNNNEVNIKYYNNEFNVKFELISLKLIEMAYGISFNTRIYFNIKNDDVEKLSELILKFMETKKLENIVKNKPVKTITKRKI